MVSYNSIVTTHRAGAVMLNLLHEIAFTVFPRAPEISVFLRKNMPGRVVVVAVEGLGAVCRGHKVQYGIVSAQEIVLGPVVGLRCGGFQSGASGRTPDMIGQSAGTHV